MEGEVIRYKYIFDEEITVESVNRLIEVLYSYQSVDLFFSTQGGLVFAIDVLIEAINEHPDITVTLCSSVCSAGTFLLTDLECPVYVHDNLDFIMIHAADRMVEGQVRKTDLDYAILKEQLESANRIRAEKYKKLGVPKKYLDRYLKGEDVYLYKEDINKLKINNRK